jgi:hypothetical protein
MFGVIFSLLNMIFEDKYNEMNELQYSMGGIQNNNASSKKKSNSSANNNSINYRFKK